MQARRGNQMYLSLSDYGPGPPNRPEPGPDLQRAYNNPERRNPHEPTNQAPGSARY